MHRIRKYVGAFLVHLKGRVDAIVFSAGIGENSAYIRQEALAALQVLLPTGLAKSHTSSFHCWPELMHSWACRLSASQ